LLVDCLDGSEVMRAGGEMDQQRAQDIASDAERAGKVVSDTVNQAGAGIQSRLDQGKTMVQDLTRQASEAGRQAIGRAGEVIQGVAPQAGNQVRQAATNLYDQSSRAGEYVSQYVVQQPLTALLIAGAIGYALAYLIHRP
jgi:ElaB/YqjD/DUF883 family membrane-anchored ribosome-binding protein